MVHRNQKIKTFVYLQIHVYIDDLFSSSLYTLHFTLWPRDVGAHDSSICFFSGSCFPSHYMDDQIGKLYQFVYLYADKLNCVVKTEKRFILHENLKNPAHLNEISLLFNHHSDVHKQRSRNVDIFCIFPRCFTFNIFIKNKRQCIGRSDDRPPRGVPLEKL